MSGRVVIPIHNETGELIAYAGQTGLRRGHNDHEKHEDLALQLAERPAKGDERQIDGVQHQLDGHENRDDIALEHECHNP